MTLGDFCSSEITPLVEVFIKGVMVQSSERPRSAVVFCIFYVFLNDMQKMYV